MSAYEFWDELGNIFNAIVAYQEKTIEFNKQFVNPWIRLGTVLDQNDNNAETLAAHKKAIAIDKDNATNWLALGDVYFKMGSFEEASASYAKAIELNPKLGWAYANLALTHATRQKYTEAINMYVKSLELITDEKDRAMIWNRLGNVYRKVNDYDNAFIAFQMADECDGQNTGFEDKLDDVAVEQKAMHMVAEVYVNNNHPHVPEEPVAVTTEEAQPTEIAEEPSTAMAEASVEILEQEITYTQIEETISEAVVDEVPESLDETAESASLEVATAVEETETSELELVAEQNLDVEEVTVDVTETISAAEQEKERLELEELIQTIITKHSAEEPQIAEVTEQVDATTEEEVTQPVVEDVPATDVSAEITEETPVLESANNEAQAETDSVSALDAEPVIEDNQLEVKVESSASEIVSEESQVEAVAETSTEETAEAIEPAVMAEVPAQEIIAEEALVMEETPAPESANIDVSASTTMTPVMTHDAGTFANPLELNQPVVLVVEDLAELIDQVTAIAEAEVEAQPAETETQPEVQVEAHDLVDEVVEQAAQSESSDAELPAMEEVQPEAVEVTEEVALKNEQPEVVSEAAVEERVQSAYDEFLKNAAEPTVILTEEPTEVMAHEANVSISNAKSDLRAEPDTKNAHVWNELGNVYFNTGAYEEAITAYSKAIELDDWFAWPYSNLALVYVQKEKYAEAVLLYQRSIELFASDKDKAVTWNRLGNVYRRLNDYDNAIACYQRADELDPNNATLSQRLRFSLLGSLNMETSQSLAV
jgi:tetratricopeptide (TPR) repeat protein